MIEGTFALQISRETVPDFTTANTDFKSICDFILLPVLCTNFCRSAHHGVRSKQIGPTAHVDSKHPQKLFGSGAGCGCDSSPQRTGQERGLV